ncbi:IclR family transcriptional regulator [Roseomonas sp. AR75]|uniref:IclR family transcriptional regulator n=1 Tax=Roseomonas sp. AR75 TaxID=2562311 RepID=UPI0010C0C858|nr:helix-turn-helix domain-containing protein [Roseomonas sp. AR75]
MTTEAAPREGAAVPVAEAAERRIKSAKRTLEVLEFFAVTHRPATVMEVARALGYPQSSTSVLLGGLTRLGYLEFDAAARSYRPTLRVLLLGAWQQEALFGDTHLLRLLEELRRRSGFAVLLGMRQQAHVQYILTLRSPRGMVPQEQRAGLLKPLCRAAVGLALLLGLPDADVARLARRANAEERDPSLRVSIPALLDELAEGRARGWVESCGRVVPGASVIAMPLPALRGHPPLAVGLGGRQEAVRRARAEMIAALRATCEALARQQQ